MACGAKKGRVCVRGEGEIINEGMAVLDKLRMRHARGEGESRYKQVKEKKQRLDPVGR